MSSTEIKEELKRQLVFKLETRSSSYPFVFLYLFFCVSVRSSSCFSRLLRSTPINCTQLTPFPQGEPRERVRVHDILHRFSSLFFFLLSKRIKDLIPSD